MRCFCIAGASLPALGLSMILFVAVAADAAGEQEFGWLNAKDFGASGSSFESAATTTAGSNQITVAEPGDFQVGQGVMVSKCNVHYGAPMLFGPGHTPRRPLGDAVEMRGYDGSSGSWTVFMLDIPPGNPPCFRWSDDLGRTWHDKAPISYDWQPLSGGTEVRFKQGDWEQGHVVSFSARDQLVSTIAKIEGNVFTLKDAANRTVADAVLRHCDDEALQAALDGAIQRKCNLHIPPGRYRLFHGLRVENPQGLTIEGASPEHTILDISEGEAACLKLSKGTEATIRNLRMVGHTGFDRADQAGSLRTYGAVAVWGFYLKPCYAIHMAGTERVLVENCHASRMSGECFYSQSPSRSGMKEPKEYTKSITYLRCSVIDSARNAFNNNDGAENTSVLYCRIVDVGGCSWEGASRYVRIIGNYVRNAGPIAMGNVRSRVEHLEQLGRAQHIVADNVFEGRRNYGGRTRSGFMVNAGACATQVIVRNNLFVNFNSSGVAISGRTGDWDLPASSAVITGNIFDLTSQDELSLARTGIEVSAADVTASDNQVYVRGQPDPQVTGIRLSDVAVNLNVHDNLIRNCGAGLVAERAESAVKEVVDGVTFLSIGKGVPWERRQSHRYRGWNLAWLSGGSAKSLSVIDGFDPETLRFTLREPRAMKRGDRFEVFPPSANWTIRANTITDCLQPVRLDSYGSDTSTLSENLVTRGAATGVKEAVVVRGAFRLVRNQVQGFDEPASAALSLYPDAIGRVCHSTYEGNIVQRCALGMAESQDGLWKAAMTAGNLFLDCGDVPGESQGAR